MHPLEEKEGQLFEEWRVAMKEREEDKNDKNFIVDGIIDIEGYLRSFPRILIVMKEPNEENYDITDKVNHNWNMKSLLYNGAENHGQTFNALAHWIHGLRTGIEYDFLPEPTVEFRQTVFRSIAMMNLKKRGGTNCAPYKRIDEYTRRYKDFIRRQVALYDPDIIVSCCHDNSRYFCEDVLGLQARMSTSNSGENLWWASPEETNKFFLFQFHPGVRTDQRELYSWWVSHARSLLPFWEEQQEGVVKLPESQKETKWWIEAN